MVVSLTELLKKNFVIYIYIRMLEIHETSFEFHKNTFVVKYDPTDMTGLAAINEIVTDNVYVLDKFVNLEGKVLIDIGANIGIATIIMAKLNPKSIVYAFEPFNKSYELLLENIKANNLSNVIPFNLAVSNKTNKKLNLSIFGLWSGANSTNSDPNLFGQFYGINKENQIIECISFDKIITDNNINEIYLLKIDCEGAEYDIIYDSDKFKNGVVKNIVGEFHDIKYMKNEKRSTKLIEYCKKYVEGVFKIEVLEIL